MVKSSASPASKARPASSCSQALFSAAPDERPQTRKPRPLHIRRRANEGVFPLLTVLQNISIGSIRHAVLSLRFAMQSNAPPLPRCRKLRLE
ncbi:hypothetical protein F2981_24250 (plasmid) [Sinorhizobium meliloti]|nr:hypothetical protein [Sinorhizobium meliloti]